MEISSTGVTVFRNSRTPTHWQFQRKSAKCPMNTWWGRGQPQHIQPRISRRTWISQRIRRDIEPSFYPPNPRRPRSILISIPWVIRVLHLSIPLIFVSSQARSLNYGIRLRSSCGSLQNLLAKTILEEFPSFLKGADHVHFYAVLVTRRFVEIELDLDGLLYLRWQPALRDSRSPARFGSRTGIGHRRKIPEGAGAVPISRGMRVDSPGQAAGGRRSVRCALATQNRLNEQAALSAGRRPANSRATRAGLSTTIAGPWISMRGMPRPFAAAGRPTWIKDCMNWPSTT